MGVESEAAGERAKMWQQEQEGKRRFP